jgi:hypothetical protein
MSVLLYNVYVEFIENRTKYIVNNNKIVLCRDRFAETMPKEITVTTKSLSSNRFPIIRKLIDWINNLDRALDKAGSRDSASDNTNVSYEIKNALVHVHDILAVCTKNWNPKYSYYSINAISAEMFAKKLDASPKIPSRSVVRKMHKLAVDILRSTTPEERATLISGLWEHLTTLITAYDYILYSELMSISLGIAKHFGVFKKNASIVAIEVPNDHPLNAMCANNDFTFIY